MVLYLVRHGRPVIDPAVPAARWVLDAAHEHAVTALAARAPWPGDAVWFTSPEPKAMRTAFLLAGRDVPVVDGLREHERSGAGWVEGFAGLVREAVAHPHSSVRDGWEPVHRTRLRVVDAVREIVAGHPGKDIVLVGHGTAWTLLAAVLTGTDPDLDRWATLAMPDVIVVTRTTLLTPVKDAGPNVWHEHLWDRLAVDTTRPGHHGEWAAPLVGPLRDDPLTGALFPVLSHGVLHLRGGPIPADDARLVAMLRALPDGRLAGLVPAVGEVFDTFVIRVRGTATWWAPA